MTTIDVLVVILVVIPCSVFVGFMFAVWLVAMATRGQGDDG